MPGFRRQGGAVERQTEHLHCMRGGTRVSDSNDAVRGAQKALQAANAAQRTAGQVRQVAHTAQSNPGQAVKQAAGAVASGVGGPVGEAIHTGLEALSGFEGLISSGLRPVDKVRFAFHPESDPGGSWRVVSLHAQEGLSELYTCTLDLANEDLGADVDGLLGSSCEVLISRDATSRRLCGIVHRVEHTGTKAGHLLARVFVVPALWALSQRKDSYIFQEKTVPQILEEVLSEGLQPFERSFRMQLDREYLPREYCVQYRETDLDFVLRLMEEEGLFFFFEHSGEREELVLVELNEQCPTCETVGAGPIKLMGPEAGTAQDETLRSFEFAQKLHTTSVVVRDFNWTHPDYDLTREARAEDAHGRDRESYEYPAPLLGPYDKGEKKYKYEPAQKQEELRRQAFQSEGRRGRGEGTVTGFVPGAMFELTGHGHPALDGWYLLTRVEHFGHAPEELTSDSHEEDKEGAGHERYRNAFESLPLDVAFRPERRRSRARMAGLQTATVVGPSGEEIFTDEHGRIKVQFHWDRAGQRNEKSSCFLRVAQVWSGLGWGFVFLPRIGMEVLVDFLEGDPDRPLVVGCVYNGQNQPPYPLPDQKTRSTIRTSSTPGGDGFNELRFEDAAGEEELFIHAQKDFNEVVLNNHSTQVKANQSNAVDGSQTETVGGEQSMTVTGNRTKTVKKNETTHVVQSRTETVDIDETVTIKGKRTEEVTGQEKLTLKAGRDATVNTLEKLLVTGRRDETINANDDLKVGGDKTDHITGKYAMTGDNEVKLNQGDVSITLNRGGANVEGSGQKVSLHNSSGQMVFDAGKVELTCTGQELSLVCGAASIKLKSDGTVEINGGKEVGIGAQQSTVKLEAAGATISAPKLTSSAIGIHEITGALIKIN
nr:type VI secretion system tip protein TssI/VgrG [Corallococcus exiguus]